MATLNVGNASSLHSIKRIYVDDFVEFTLQLRRGNLGPNTPLVILKSSKAAQPLRLVMNEPVQCTYVDRQAVGLRLKLHEFDE